MAVPSDSPAAGAAVDEATTPATQGSGLKTTNTAPLAAAETPTGSKTPEKATKTEGHISSPEDHHGVNPLDFEGSVDSTNELPSIETLRKIENYVVLDRHGKSHPFKSLYTGKHVARRVLIIFVRHFFCGVSPPPPSPKPF